MGTIYRLTIADRTSIGKPSTENSTELCSRLFKGERWHGLRAHQSTTQKHKKLQEITNLLFQSSQRNTTKTTAPQRTHPRSRSAKQPHTTTTKQKNNTQPTTQNPYSMGRNPYISETRF